MRQKIVSGIIGFIIVVALVFGIYRYFATHQSLRIPFITTLLTDVSHLSFPKVTPTPATTNTIKLFFVALNDNGIMGEKIGCNDSLVGLNQDTLPANTSLRKTLEQLFAIKDKTYGPQGLYNSLYQSNLLVDDVEIDQTGHATVEVAGGVVLGGVCDGPRFVSQIRQTVLQFPTIKSATITVNGQPLDLVASGK